MKRTYLLLLFLLVFRFYYSQNETIAKIKFEEAETFYNDKNYSNAYSTLNEVESILKSTNPKVLYLKILCLSELVKNGNYDDQFNYKYCINYYLKNYNQEAFYEQYKQIYELSKSAIYIDEEVINDYFKAKKGDIAANSRIGIYLSDEYGDDESAVSFLNTASIAKEPLASYKLGILYKYLPFMKDTLKGNELMSTNHKKILELADKGNSIALNLAGEIYLRFNTTKDFPKALSYFKKAAGKNIGRSFYYLALMHNNGEGTNVNKELFVENIKKSAEKGNVYALNELGELYYSGNGVTQDYKQAFKYFSQAALMGDPVPKYNLASLYATGQGVEKDLNKAIENLTKCAESKHYIAGQSCSSLGTIYYNNKNYNSAIVWFKKAIEKGYKSENSLGLSYYEVSDFKNAMNWFLKAIEKDPKKGNGYYNIGEMYYSGAGVEMDCAKAVEWYTKAANLGHIESMKKLYFIYDKAYIKCGSVKKDKEIAQMWNEKSKSFKTEN